MLKDDRFLRYIVDELLREVPAEVVDNPVEIADWVYDSYGAALRTKVKNRK